MGFGGGGGTNPDVHKSMSKNNRTTIIIGVIFAIIIGSFFYGLSNIENNKNKDEIIEIIEDNNLSPNGISDDLSQNFKLDPETNFLKNNFEPNNPKIIINDDVGFQVTIPDPEDYDLSKNSSVSWFLLRNIESNKLFHDPLNNYIWGWQKQMFSIEP